VLRTLRGGAFFKMVQAANFIDFINGLRNAPAPQRAGVSLVQFEQNCESLPLVNKKDGAAVFSHDL